MNKKHISTIIVIALAIPIIISQIIRIKTGTWTIGDENSWVSFFGSYLGGIVGGIVALYIARVQIIENQNYNIRNEEELRYINQLPAIVSIKYELEKIGESIKYIIETVEQSSKEEGVNAAELIKDMWFGCYELKESNWSTIAHIEDVDFHSNLVEIKNKYTDYRKVLVFDLHQATNDLQKLMFEGDVNSNIYLINEKGNEMERMKELKSKVYLDIKENDFIRVAEDAIYSSNLILESIEELKEKRTKIRDK